MVLACLAALFLSSSAIHFGGHKVDESEIVMNALTIATGDWDPVWSPGYGHLAMYLPAAVLGMLALFLQASGAAASYSDGLYLLFADDAAYRVVRFIYAVADVLTALLLARVIVLVTGQRLLAATFVLYFFASPDTWLYANYIRTDTLVSLFVACAIYAIATQRNRSTPFTLGLALGAAIACKYSAAVYMVLVAFLLLPVEGTAIGFRKRLGMATTAGLVAILSAFVFQPLYDYSGILSAVNTHLTGSHFTQEVAPLGERLSRLWRLVHLVEPLPLVLAVAMLGCLLRPRSTIPLMVVVGLGIAPFALSNFPREYWLLPFADGLRAAGWLGVACVAQYVGSRFGTAPRRILVGLLVVAAIAIAWNRAPQLLRTHRVAAQGLSNAEAARRWLYVHAVNRKPVIYGYEKNFLLPRAYSFADYDQAADLSRVFIFYREDFQSLHELFHRRLYTHEYAQFSSMTKVPPLRLSMTEAARTATQQPAICAGDRCFPPKQAACSANARSRFADCVTYTWDMDRPALRHDLAVMSLKLSPTINDFAVCWYDCENDDAEVPVYRRHDGRVPLLQIADRLFAPMRVLGLTQLKTTRGDGVGAYIVTTPKAYVPWLPKNNAGDRVNDSAEFAKAINARLIRYFDSGSGPRIEIYVKEEG